MAGRGGGGSSCSGLIVEKVGEGVKAEVWARLDADKSYLLGGTCPC